MAQGKKKFNKNPAKKQSSAKRHKASGKSGPRVGRVKAPKKAAAISSHKLKANLTRALGQKIEHDMAREAVSNSIHLRVVSMPVVQEPKKKAVTPAAKKS